MAYLLMVKVIIKPKYSGILLWCCIYPIAKIYMDNLILHTCNVSEILEKTCYMSTYNCLRKWDLLNHSTEQTEDKHMHAYNSYVEILQCKVHIQVASHSKVLKKLLAMTSTGKLTASSPRWGRSGLLSMSFSAFWMPVMAELIVPSRALWLWLSPACKAEFWPYRTKKS